MYVTPIRSAGAGLRTGVRHPKKHQIRQTKSHHGTLEQRRATCSVAGCMGRCGKPPSGAHRARRTHRPPQPCRAWPAGAPTVHEGVVARAMEKKGIISDRCELNRQIKADNALLRGTEDRSKSWRRQSRTLSGACRDHGKSAKKIASVLLSAGVSPQGKGTPEHFAEYAAPCPHTVQSAGKGHPR